MRFIQLIFFVLIALPAFSQYYVMPESSLQEGIYMKYADYLDNNPIETELVKKGSDIFVWDEPKGKEVMLDPDKIWGYSINNNIYISYEDSFWKLINQGKLNHFSAIVIRYYQTYDSFGFMVERASKVLTHLFFDIADGRIMSLNKSNFEKYFDQDPKLEKYYRKLKGNKTERLIMVLQAYNERHPKE